MYEPKENCLNCGGKGFTWVQTVDGDADTDPCDCVFGEKMDGRMESEWADGTFTEVSK